MSEHTQPARKPVDYDELYPGRFLKSGLFLGKLVTLTISAVDVEALPQADGSNRIRGVISFSERPQQWVLNSTNGQCLRALWGRSVQEWIGHRVTLKVERAENGEDGIRVAGSPELAEPMTITIELSRRKPRQRLLEPTGKAARPSQPREPGEEG